MQSRLVHFKLALDAELYVERLPSHLWSLESQAQVID